MNQNVFNNYKILLAEFLKFKSISTDKSYLPEIEKASIWLSNLFKKNGFKSEIWKGNDCNPVVFAEFSPPTSNGKLLKTVLVYGHYDVQPAKIDDGWRGDPFTLGDDGKRLYGRGVIDNKGQVLVHMATIFSLIKEKKLTRNVKFIIEGNEETGNPGLSNIMINHKKELSADFVMISDGELTNNKPTIETSLRGGFNCKLTFTTGKNNLHSGAWGGAVPNSAHELAKFAANLFNDSGEVNFKEFYRGLDKLEPAQINNNNKLEREAGNIAKLAGVSNLLKNPKYDFFTVTGLMPTIQVTGIKSGYIEEGFSNIIPAVSEVRLNFRIAPSQKSTDIINAFKKYVKAVTPKYVKYKLEFVNPHEPVKISTDNQYLKEIEVFLKNVYKEPVNYRNVGGAIPFVSDVKKILGVGTVSVPFANEDCNMHGVNENYEIKYLKKALEFSRSYFSKS